MTQLLPAAVLWDMDGTLVDTEPYWFNAEVELLQSFGQSWTKADGLTLVGSGLWRTASIVQARGVDLTEDEIVAALTNSVMKQIETAVPWRTGSLELLAEIRAAGIPTALVTMSVHRMAEHVVSKIPLSVLPTGGFDHIVSGDSVVNSKPHPEAYHRAAELLGVDILACVAIEDSIPGIASAVASGAVAIGVPLHVTLDHSPGYTLWPTLENRTLADLISLYTDARNTAS